MQPPNNVRNEAFPHALDTFYTAVDRAWGHAAVDPSVRAEAAAANRRHLRQAASDFRSRKERIVIKWLEPEVTNTQVRKTAIRVRQRRMDHRYGVWYLQDESVV